MDETLKCSRCPSPALDGYTLCDECLENEVVLRVEATLREDGEDPHADSDRYMFLRQDYTSAVHQEFRRAPEPRSRYTLAPESKPTTCPACRAPVTEDGGIFFERGACDPGGNFYTDEGSVPLYICRNGHRFAWLGEMSLTQLDDEGQSIDVRASEFAIGDSAIYPGFTRHESRNIIAVPLFTKDVAERIAADYTASERAPDGTPLKAYFSQPADAFHVEAMSQGRLTRRTFYGRIERVGGTERTLYGIGVGLWPWREVADD